MKEFFKILELKPQKPTIWNFNSKILQEKSHTIKTLVPYTQEEKFIVFKRKIIALSSKSYQKKQIQERWLVKSSDNIILGPFTKNEMKSKSDEELKDCMIKRDFDKEFVKYEKIKEELPDFLDSDKLNDYFSSVENSCINSSSGSINCSTNSDLSNTSNNSSSKTQNLSAEQIEKNIKKLSLDSNLKLSKNFLSLKNESCDINSLLKKIQGMNQNTAISIIKTNGNLSTEDSKRFIELLIKETGNSVLVDNEGFIKAQKKFNKK